MAAQRQIPGGPYLNESGSSQRQIPGGPYANETVTGGLETRYGRPVSDTSAGAWSPSTGGALYAMVDEITADDSDYIYASSATEAVMKCTSLDLGSMTTPKISIQVPTGFTAAGTLNVKLYQGNPGSEIARVTTTNPAAGEYTHTLTAPEIAAITNGSDLYWRIEAA